MADLNKRQIMFSQTFVLRKECVLLSTLLDCAKDMHTRGYCVTFSMAPEKSSRWFQIRAFERKANHPTFTFNRMLATVPSIMIKNALSVLSFGCNYDCALQIKVEDDNKTFTISLLEPKGVQDKKAVEAHMRLLGF